MSLTKGDHFHFQTSKIKSLIEIFNIIKREKKICPFVASPDGLQITLNDDKSTCVYIFLNKLFFDSYQYNKPKSVLFGLPTNLWFEVFKHSRNFHIRTVEVYNNIADHQIVTTGEDKNGVKKTSKIQVSEIPRQFPIPEGSRNDRLGIEIPAKWFWCRAFF